MHPDETAVGVVIRRGIPDEWREYKQLRVRALRDAPHAFTSTVAREQGYDEKEMRRRLAASHTLIAWLDADTVGTVAALTDDDPLRWNVVAMWVDPSARGRGIATALLDEIESAASLRGIRRLHLWVVDGNDAAESLYARRGYAATGERERLPDGRTEFAMELTVAR